MAPTYLQASEEGVVFEYQQVSAAAHLTISTIFSTDRFGLQILLLPVEFHDKQIKDKPHLFPLWE